MHRSSTGPVPDAPAGRRTPPPRAPRRKPKRWWVLATALAGTLAGAIACSGTSSTSVEPTTGIVVRAETLMNGRGCGRGPTNIFKYAVVVFGYESGDELATSSYTRRITSNVFDCFTDGTFIELTPVAGNSRFRLEVYAYNEPAYLAARERIESAGTNTTILRETSPTWTTECTATQQRDVQALALCAPLEPGLGGLGEVVGPTQITVATSRFELPDGRVAQCRTSPPDAGADAEADADIEDSGAPDAGPEDAGTEAPADAGEPDAAPQPGPPLAFTTARLRFRVGATVVGPTIDVPCPDVATVDVPPDPQRYEIDVGLLDGTQPLGQTTCTVTTQAGTTSSAVCSPNP